MKKKLERNMLARQLVGEGKTYEEVGEMLGISRQRVFAIIKSLSPAS